MGKLNLNYEGGSYNEAMKTHGFQKETHESIQTKIDEYQEFQAKYALKDDLMTLESGYTLLCKCKNESGKNVLELLSEMTDAKKTENIINEIMAFYKIKSKELFKLFYGESADFQEKEDSSKVMMWAIFRTLHAFCGLYK